MKLSDDFFHLQNCSNRKKDKYKQRCFFILEVKVLLFLGSQKKSLISNHKKLTTRFVKNILRSYSLFSLLQPNSKQKWKQLICARKRDFVAEADWAELSLFYVNTISCFDLPLHINALQLRKCMEWKRPSIT